MNRPLKNFLDVLLCIAIFAVVQIFIQLAVAGIYSFVKEVDFTTVSDGLAAGKYSDLIVVSSVLSSLVTLLIFTCGKFAVIACAKQTSAISPGIFLKASFTFRAIDSESPHAIID